MKYLFVLVAILLVACSGLVWTSMPQGLSDRQVVMYWTTDPNPARVEQVRLFDEWQVERGLYEVVEGDPAEEDILDEASGEYRRPLIELRLDTGNNENTKKVVQSVSGVAAEAMDMFSGQNMQFFEQMGVLEDVTDEAEALGFSVDTTYDAMLNELSLVDFDGERRQFMFPCNVAMTMFMVNKPLFRELGLPVPEGHWTIEEFEAAGKAFVEATNEPGQRFGRKFFIDGINERVTYRSMGVDTFNETATDVNIEDPRVIRTMEMIRRWIYEDRLIPTGADRQNAASAGGYGGGGAELFERDIYAMFNGGRWHLIRFRETNRGRVSRGEPPLEIGTVGLPNGGVPNVLIGTRAAAVYVDGVRMEEPVDVDLSDGRTVTLPAGTHWGVIFQAFLASKQYNDQIIADADGLPPNPLFTQSEAYLRPEKDPVLGIYPETEYEVHGPHLEAASTIAIPATLSPFILHADVEREEASYRSRYMSQPQISGFEDPRVAMSRAAQAIRAQIRENLEFNPELQAEYDRRVEDQKTIDRLKAEGKPIPARLIRNPYYLYLYEKQDMLEGSATEGGLAPVDAPLPAPTTPEELNEAPSVVEEMVEYESSSTAEMPVSEASVIESPASDSGVRADAAPEAQAADPLTPREDAPGPEPEPTPESSVSPAPVTTRPATQATAQSAQ
ncbi:MAG: ABC transporter substrate-binding protein [Planctomycetota bacterium]